LATRCCGEKGVFELRRGMEWKKRKKGVGSDHDDGTVEGGCI
jgi:hypothetical protein